MTNSFYSLLTILLKNYGEISKLVDSIFFRVTPVLQWFQLNFGAGNFCGRRPGTSALRMLLRLTAVKGFK